MSLPDITTAATPDVLVTEDVPSPIGTIRVVAQGGRVVGCDFASEHDRLDASLARRFPGAARHAGAVVGADAVRAYLDGDVTALDDVAVDLGGTPFQQRVWAALREIPAGSTVTYAEIARRIGQPRAVRAVGTANGANPVAIIVPCHRVVPAAGGVGGYAGGTRRKTWLLAHEDAAARADQSQALTGSSSAASA